MAIPEMEKPRWRQDGRTMPARRGENVRGKLQRHFCTTLLFVNVVFVSLGLISQEPCFIKISPK